MADHTIRFAFYSAWYNLLILSFPAESHLRCGCVSFAKSLCSVPLNWGDLACSAHKNARRFKKCLEAPGVNEKNIDAAVCGAIVSRPTG